MATEAWRCSTMAGAPHLEYHDNSHALRRGAMSPLDEFVGCNYRHDSDIPEAAMRHKSFQSMQCPIARGLERVGEWWTILILRDAFRGLRRFDEFRESLGIAPTMLTRRLNGLVETGLLERRQYSEHPPRDEYVLTEMGRDFR